MNIDRDRLIHMLRDMLLARRFEERAAEAYSEGKFGGFLHLYPGEEAVAVGVLHAAEPSDYVVTTYRDHVHALVRGIPAREVMAELYGKLDGICKGMGGSMHLFDPDRRFMGGYAIVGETFPIAIGIGYGIVLRRLPEAVICFFGDGAVNQGNFHESLNMAALWNLPVLFVCENNRYQIGTEIHRHSAETEIYKRACAYRMPAEKTDGMDVVEVYQVTERMLREIRQGAGPHLLELETYRFRGHSMADPGTYRPRQEVEAFRRTEPIKRVERALTSPYPPDEAIRSIGPDTIDRLVSREPIIDQELIEKLKQEINEIVDDAVDFAERSPEPSMRNAWDAMYMNRKYETLIRKERGQ